ncbi:hypothetical protein BCR33DRAFT_699986 [Rhizoclosmatium globosum]|uniref:Uncharacterized protein n=1 Tax=Rhizoclosmatium globosum TaxID=329046 RepID=A0A1Y2BXV2_9FUNG|nr:hypothetical protein BCR33DRAFT_699986 [Rhizoclosmatium globosum]|eukprot:ORY39600.1 hypothetical protein BCR33DRAFT_699986 [Rhizoclosmatium globosum]
MGKRDRSPVDSTSRKHQRKEHSDDESDTEIKVSNPISDDDFYNKSSEFVVWLKEKKGKYLSDLSSKEARKYFAKFVKKWNRCFYSGIASTDIDSNARSKHKWNFKVTEADEQRLVEAKDSVHSLTASALETEKKRSGGSAGRRTNIDEDMDDEDRARYEKALRKKDAKSYDSTRQAALDELVPKATGREAQLEKRKAQNAFHKQERDYDVSLNDSDLMGGGDSFAAHLARERARKERYEERKSGSRNPKEELDSRVQNYKQKEDATMAMLRDLAKKHHGGGGNH